MALSQDTLAGKPRANEPFQRSSLLSQAEKRLGVFLREIETDSGSANTSAAVLDTGKEKRLLRTFILTDIAALILGFFCAWFLATAVNIVFLHREDLNTLTKDDLLVLMQYFIIGGCLLLWFGHSQHYQQRMPFWMETKKIVEAVGFAMLISCFLQVVSKTDFSRLWLLLDWTFSAVGIISLRSMWKAVLRRRGEWQIRTLLIGDGQTADEAHAALKSEPGLGYQIVAQIKQLPEAFQTAGHSWKRLCASHNTEYVVIALDGDNFVDARQSLSQLMREQIPFSISPPMQNLSVIGMAQQCFMGHDVMLLTRNNGLDRPLPRFVKRAFDIAVSSISLLVLSPLLLLLTVMVKLDGGPAFYKHERIGLNGETFFCLKFRSMIVNSETVLNDYLEKYPLARAEWLRDHKLRKDPRITSIGSVLRRTSLDELPQIINVLRGDMSIVGPRPIINEETEKYHKDIAFYHRVRPGITGLWQVSGRNNVAYAERVRMDSWYVRNWSLWHDITIIFKTVSVVLKQDGAY